MTIWIIEPHDPLIFRDGRPFDSTPGAQSTSLAFPLPASTTGGVRTRAGLDDKEQFDESRVEMLKQLSVRGPLLVQFSLEDNSVEWLAPAPHDAAIFEPDLPQPSPVVRRLVPVKLPVDTQTDLPTAQQADEDGLLLVGLPQPDRRKPAKNAPPYWSWPSLQQWLQDPAAICATKDARQLGHNGPEREQRTHVSIDSEREIGKDGLLFETQGLEFTHTESHRLHTAQRLALALAVDDEGAPYIPKEGFASLGGERRIVYWHKSDMQLPECPQDLIQTIIEKKACRILLLTPAYFKEGYRPSWLLKEQYGVQPELRAMIVQRPQVISGWDLLKRGPKPTRRLAPAGSVIFLKLLGDPDALREWVKAIWMHCVSDDLSFRLDGFGMAVLGTWSGKPEKLEDIKEEQAQ